MDRWDRFGDKEFDKLVADKIAERMADKIMAERQGNE
jgi:hypothetical protein